MEVAGTPSATARTLTAAGRMDAPEIFRFLARKAATGPVALVTITAVAGSSMRNPGTHLAVAADGDWAGSLSGGCIESAVVAEALDALAVGKAREMRFGAGSPYIDIRLPCGGALDVLVSIVDDPALFGNAARLFERRQPFVLRLPLADGLASIHPGERDWTTRRSDAAFSVAHCPPLAITVVGHGAAVEALELQARVAGAFTRVLTPDPSIANRLESSGVPVTLLRMPSGSVDLAADKWTAIAFLFHDHDWETALLSRALASPAFYVGAMGSPLTHAARVAALTSAGTPAKQIARLHAPIGLIRSTRDPQILALSVLAEIVQEFGTLSGLCRNKFSNHARE